MKYENIKYSIKNKIMKNISCIIFTLMVIPAFAQRIDNLSKGDRDRIEFSQERNIEGTEFLYDGWNRGELVINDSIFLNQKYLKYDAFRGVLLMRESMDTKPIEVLDNDLTGFSIIEHEEGLPHTYLKLSDKDFLEAHNNYGFYEVSFNIENKNNLIKKNFKVLYDPNKSSGTETINNVPLSYKLKKKYYLKNANNLYVKTKLSKRSIIHILNKHSVKVNRYIKVQKIKCNNESDVVKLAAYYYSLEDE